MAPIKFEEDMKDKLEKRTLQPSAKSWNTLSQRLDNHEKKNTKLGFFWLTVAASIVGVLLVYTVFFSTKTNSNTNTILVEDNTEIDTLTIKAPKQILEAIKQDVVTKTEETEIKKQTNNKTLKKPQALNNVASNTIQTVKEKTKTVVNNIKIKEPILINNSSVKNEALVANIDNQTNSITTGKNKNSLVTDHEINVLLAKATQDIALQKTKSKTIPLNYNGLLIDVEDDLNESVRDKMLKVVKKGYESLRESVAERNE